jgi:cyclohexadieny/prephenate dehydrogenase
MKNFRKISVIGLGLIASSICLAIRQKDPNIRITGYDKDPAVRNRAKKINLCEVKNSTRSAVSQSDLIILCVPVGQMHSAVKQFKLFVQPGTIITDVGSVKLSIIQKIECHVEAFKGKFVPSHPIAGTERSGPEAGYAGLFKDRWCILTPTKKTNKSAQRIVENFWKFLGMRTKIMTPEHHDLVLAVTSHAPHLIAYTMVGVVDDLEAVTKSEIINYSAAGFRDFTRIAASDPIMWRDIFLNNQEAHLEVLGRFTEELFSLQRAIRKKDGDYLLKYFERTRSIRKSIVAAGQDISTPNFGRD